MRDDDLSEVTSVLDVKLGQYIMHVSITTDTPPLDTVVVLSYNGLTQYIDLNFIKNLNVA